MNEPLTNSFRSSNFIGKTYNKHPQWYNTPLRLTKEQKHNPTSILVDFFECYHLHEVREILWEWLTEVVSSNRSTFNDSYERSNQIYFYEKVEALVESCFILQKKYQKHFNKQERIKLRKQADPSEQQTAKAAVYQPETPKNEQSIVERNDQFNKSVQLIERVADDPMYVISQVFKDESLSFLQDQLRDWQKVAISADTAVYEEGDQRGQLLTFVDQLHIFIDALYIITIRHSNEEDVKYKETTSFLSQKQIAEPMQVINAFFTKFPIAYIRRELNDLLEAGITFSGTYPDNMNELELLYTYRNVLCLIESANNIFKEGLK